MKARLLALGLALAASAGPLAAQQKMPLPVEDDPNAPPALHRTAPATTPAVDEAPSSPYSAAMVAYKAADYDKALDLIKGIDPTTQDDNFIILEADILTELQRYEEGEKLLRARLAGPHQVEIESALGDLLLHKRSYERATKYYTAALKAKPNDPDLTLKLIYARIGAADYRTAGQLASQLSPFDPKNPYDDHASYYFARAALAQATGNTSEADEDIQTARTNYGITVTNRYLKTYLHFFAPPDKDAPNDLTPAKKP